MTSEIEAIVFFYFLRTIYYLYRDVSLILFYTKEFLMTTLTVNTTEYSSSSHKELKDIEKKAWDLTTSSEDIANSGCEFTLLSEVNKVHSESFSKVGLDLGLNEPVEFQSYLEIKPVNYQVKHSFYSGLYVISNNVYFKVKSVGYYVNGKKLNTLERLENFNKDFRPFTLFLERLEAIKNFKLSYPMCMTKEEFLNIEHEDFLKSLKDSMVNDTHGVMKRAISSGQNKPLRSVLNLAIKILTNDKLKRCVQYNVVDFTLVNDYYKHDDSTRLLVPTKAYGRHEDNVIMPCNVDELMQLPSLTVSLEDLFIGSSTSETIKKSIRINENWNISNEGVEVVYAYTPRAMGIRLADTSKTPIYVFDKTAISSIDLSKDSFIVEIKNLGVKKLSSIEDITKALHRAIGQAAFNLKKGEDDILIPIDIETIYIDQKEDIDSDHVFINAALHFRGKEFVSNYSENMEVSWEIVTEKDHINSDYYLNTELKAVLGFRIK